MAASKPASAAKIRYLRARNLLGGTIACILVASCSASDAEPELSLAPASDYETSAPAGGDREATGVGEGTTALPQVRPQQIANQQTSDIPTASGEAESVAARGGTGEAKTAGAQDGQQSEQPSEATASAESPEGGPAKRSLLPRLFASAPTQPSSRQQASGPNRDTAGSVTAASELADERESKTSAKSEAKTESAAEPEDAEDQIAVAESRAPNQPASQKRNFLSAFFSPSSTKPEVPFPDEKAELEKSNPISSEQSKPLIEAATAKEEPAKPIISLASTSPTQAAMYSMDALPGVRPGDQLFEIRLGSQSDDGDVDVYEQEEGFYQVASAAGLARLAPNGLLKQRDSVNVSCFKPGLVNILKTIERRFGKRVVVTSGYRSPEHNKRVRGAPRSQHMNCAAADIVVQGVSKWELARFARSLPNRGGVGTYCHTNAVHVDVGPERDWNWRCRGR